jgi:hypothetical protein
MDKKVFSFFTFGFFLILIGIVGKFAGWEQANVIMALGLVFETLAVLIIAWKKIKNK